MSQLIANRYLPLRPLDGAIAPGEAWPVRDTVRGVDRTLAVVASADEAGEHWLLQVRAGALARLRHPAMQAVHEAGHLADGSLYVVASPAAGRPVAEVLPLPPDQVPGVFLGLCQALQALHGRGFAHGALGVEHITLADGFAPTLGHGPRLGLGARAQDDLQALGTLFFHLLTGRAPAPGEVQPSTVAHNVPPHEDALVQRLLAGACETIEDVFLLLPVTADEQVPLPLGEAPLVGRDAPVAALAETWQAVRSERKGRLVAVGGEAGCGKSRLLDELALAWRLAGTPVLEGRASAGDAPYRAWVEVLRQAMPLARQRAPEAFAATAPILTGLVGDLGVPPAPALEPRQDKLRMQGAIAELLGALAAQGLVIVLEDWPQADPLSQEALAFVARVREDRPLLILLAGDHPEADAAIALDALDRAAVGQMAKDLLGGRPLTDAALSAVLAATHGNPRLVAEQLAHLAQAGALAPGEAGWSLTDGTLDRPASLEDLYRARLGRLDAQALEAARLAAVLGVEGELALLDALWPHGGPALTKALESLRAEGMLQTSGAYYRFESPRWPALLQAGAAPTAWTHWHDQAASKLAELAERGQAPSDWAIRLAAHALAGSDADRAIAAALEAGQVQLRFNAPAAARRFLEQGLAMWEREGGSNGRHAGLELGYRRLLGDVLRHAGDYGQAVALYERACELAKDEPAVLGHMLTSSGKCLQMSNKYAEAESFYQSALEVYQGVTDAPGKLRAMTSLARCQMVVGNRARAEKLYLQALEEAEAAGDRPSLGEALGTLGYMIVANEPARIQDGIGYLERSVALRKEMGDKIGLNDAYSLLGNAYITLGQYVKAKDAFVRNQRLCFECGLADEEIFALINLSIVALEMGECRRAHQLALAARERADKSGSRFCYALAIALEALANAYLAELTDVMALMEEAVAIARELKNKYLEINIQVWYTEALLIFGRLTDSVAVAHQATALMEELGYREFEPRLLVFQAEVHGRLAEREEAHALLSRAHDLARENQNAGMTARVLKTLSWLYLQEKNPLQARDHARQALEVATGIGAGYLAGEAHWLIGEVDLAAGQHEQATRELQKALDAGEQTESPHLQCLALFCLARASDDEFRTREYLFQARDMLRAQLAQLSDLDREDYLALAERWRVDRGELVFAEKARSQKGHPELGPEGRLYFERMKHFAAFAAALHGLDLEGSLASLLELLEAQRVCVLLDTHEGRRLAHHVRGGDEPSSLMADRQVLEGLLGTPDIFYQPFVSEDARFAGLYPGLPSSLLAAPFGHGVVLAVRQGSTFTPQEVEAIALAATQFGVAVVNADRLGVGLVE